MKPAVFISFLAAALFHALLLFGFRLGTTARPLAMSDEPSAVDVNLVAASDNTDAPASPAELASTPPPAPPAAPTPEPTPEPVATPEPPVPEPMATPVVASTPEPRPQPMPASDPKPRPQVKPKSAAPPHPTGYSGGHSATQSTGAHGISAGGGTTRHSFPVESSRVPKSQGNSSPPPHNPSGFRRGRYVKNGKNY